MYRVRFSSRRLAGAGALGAAVALAATLTLSGAAAASAPRCSTSSLVVWLNTQSNGAAGTIYYNVEFTNLSTRACTLAGYPGVSAVDIAGRQLGSAASRNPAQRARTITLSPAAATNTAGDTANVLLGITEAGNFPASACHQVTAAGLRIYPPNQTASRVVPFPFSACSRGGPVYLHVEALRSGLGTQG